MAKNNTIVVSALRARSHFGKLLRRVEKGASIAVMEKPGAPKAVLLSIRDYVRLRTPEPEGLRVSGEESQHQGTERLTARQINQVISAARKQRSRRR